MWACWSSMGTFQLCVHSTFAEIGRKREGRLCCSYYCCETERQQTWNMMIISFNECLFLKHYFVWIGKKNVYIIFDCLMTRVQDRGFLMWCMYASCDVVWNKLDGISTHSIICNLYGCFCVSSTRGLRSDSSSLFPIRWSSTRCLGLDLRAVTRDWTLLRLRPQLFRLERKQCFCLLSFYSFWFYAIS